MAANFKKLFTTPKSSSSIMFLCGVFSFLASLAVAGAVWRGWKELGVDLGPKSLVGVIICSLVGFLLAIGSGLWALASVQKLEGRNALKCTIGYLLDAVALSLLMAFIAIAYFLQAVS